MGYAETQTHSLHIIVSFSTGKIEAVELFQKIPCENFVRGSHYADAKTNSDSNPDTYAWSIQVCTNHKMSFSESTHFIACTLSESSNDKVFGPAGCDVTDSYNPCCK